MEIRTRNRAPLAVLMGQISDSISPAAQEAGLGTQESPFGKPVPAKDYEGVIDDIRAEAMKKDPEYGDVAQKTMFINLDQMSKEQSKQVAEAIRKTDPDGSKKSSDEEIRESLYEGGPANAIPSSNIVVYSAAMMSQYSVGTAEFIIAHELGHHILLKQGKKFGDEKKADHIGAEIVGGQEAVNALKEMTQKEPKYNDRGYSERADHNAHKTNYERAVNIQKAFPHQHINLLHFPKPSKDRYQDGKSVTLPSSDRSFSMPPGF